MRSYLVCFACVKQVNRELVAFGVDYDHRNPNHYLAITLGSDRDMSLMKSKVLGKIRMHAS